MNIAELQTQVFYEQTNSLWVFAYGSLCWRPGFQFRRAVMGHVKGFQRRFWQGNTQHRGTEKKPGRVATLVEGQGKVHGIAFALHGEAAIPYLSQREEKLGGYVSHFTTFHPMQGEPFQVLVYIADFRNPHWLGYADEKAIANEIINCKGPCGTNVEYVIRLANFMREHFAEENDAHLFTIEEEVLMIMDDRKICLSSLMGTGEGCVTFVKKEEKEDSYCYIDDIKSKKIDAFQFAMKIQGTQLRCLNL
ncbi:unnamed protein product [Phyllotreta striolata]|uniref:glutathione-specific gamma-glutamylcyclotransferase n=1 Tax=Phyllotreta striolata TaxID=444603 RepID=A0A9N9XJX9_PHYSR|nr:unnamed protein product [Phyllotreta striolata]